MGAVQCYRSVAEPAQSTSSVVRAASEPGVLHDAHANCHAAVRTLPAAGRAGPLHAAQAAQAHAVLAGELRGIGNGLHLGWQEQTGSGRHKDGKEGSQRVTATSAGTVKTGLLSRGRGSHGHSVLHLGLLALHIAALRCSDRALCTKGPRVSVAPRRAGPAHPCSRGRSTCGARPR